MKRLVLLGSSLLLVHCAPSGELSAPPPSDSALLASGGGVVVAPSQGEASALPQGENSPPPPSAGADTSPVNRGGYERLIDLPCSQARSAWGAGWGRLPGACGEGQDESLADLDSDYDGVSDSDEVAAGTDPNNSSSAPAWHPEITTYPRAVFGPSDLSDVKARFARTDEPFKTLAARVRGSCNSTPMAYSTADGFDQVAVYVNGNIARNCAFLAYIENNTTAASKAKSVLLGYPSSMGSFNTDWFDNTDIHLGEGLVTIAQAYDFMRGANALSSSEISTIEANLLGLAESAYRIYVKEWAIYWKYQNNNHKTKLSAGLGMIGMVLNQNSNAAKYISYANTEIDFVMGVQTTFEGGWAEGPYYLNYGSETVLPYFLAYHRYAQGRTIPYMQYCDTRNNMTNCKKGNVQIDDFYTSPDIHATFEWWLDIMMPDGLSPDFDDANRVGTFYGFLTGMTGNGSFRAAWERNTKTPYYSSDCEDMSLETLVVFPATVASVWPASTSAFLPDAGMAVFRSSWDKTARYLMLLAEHGNMVTGGHEHPDSTEVMVHAYGEYLITDAGYGSWSQRKEVDAPENHSLVLIDDKGPSDNPMQTSDGAQTYLENCSSKAGFQRCDARANFNGVTQVRSVYFLDDLSFAVVDRMTPDSATKSHSYSSIWQLNGGSDTGGIFTASSSGGNLVRANASMVLGLASTSSIPTLSNYLDSYAPGYGEIAQHTVLKAVSSGTSAALLAVIEPRAAGEAQPVAKQVVSTGGVASILMTDGTHQTLSVVVQPGVKATLTTTQTGLPQVVTDAVFASIQFVNGVVSTVHYEGATVLTVGGVSKL